MSPSSMIAIALTALATSPVAAAAGDSPFAPVRVEPSAAEHASWTTHHPDLGLSATYARDGVRVSGEHRTLGPWEWQVRLEAWGRPGSLRAPAEPTLSVGSTRVELRRGELVEWYVNEARGFEQGFTIGAPPTVPDPARESAEPLVLVLSTPDELAGAVDADGRGVVFRGADEQAVLTYGGLRAWDANDRDLEARLVMEGEHLSILVDDSDARYPVHVDPFFVTQEAKLLARAGHVFDALGYSVFCAGERGIAGSPTLDGRGAAHVYLRVTNEWFPDGALLASDAAPGDQFGQAVCIGGTNAIAGAPGDDGVGSAYVFERLASGWVQRAKLVPSDGAAGDDFGTAVAIWGNFAMVGAPSAGPDGAVYVFERSGTTWPEVAKLTCSDPQAQLFGNALSLELARVAVGSRSFNNRGAVVTFVYNGSTWVEEDILLAPVTDPGDSFGASVSLSGDTIVGGTPYDDSVGTAAGSVSVFTLQGSSWTFQTRFWDGGGDDNEHFGQSVSLSGDTVVVGSPRKETPGQLLNGAARVYVRSGTTWSYQAQLTADHGNYLGRSIAFAGDWVLLGIPSLLGNEPGSVLPWRRSGSNWYPVEEWTALDTGSGDELGSSLAVYLDTAVAGAPLDDHGGNADAGSAQVYERDDDDVWQWSAKLVASSADANADDRFGCSVAVSDAFGGTRIVVGADGDDEAAADAGAAYVFGRSGGIWTEQLKLTASDATSGALFGYSVAIRATFPDPWTVVGAPGDSGAALIAGAVYVFDDDGIQVAKLTASDAAGFDLFGSSVALWGATIVVGCPKDDHAGGNDAGSAYVFVWDGSAWSQQAKLIAGDADSTDEFGTSVAVWGNTIVVGAPWSDAPGAPNAGAGYVFVRSGMTWTQETKLVPADALLNDHFGTDVAVTTNAAALGGPDDDHSGAAHPGSVRLFLRAGSVWQEKQTLIGTDVASGNAFGRSVALSIENSVPSGERTLFVAAPQENALGAADSGTVTVLEYSGFGVQSCFGVGCPCGNDDPSGGCANSRGSGAVLAAAGSDRVTQQAFELQASGLPFFTQGLFYMGDSVVEAPFFDGKQCALGNTFRFLDSVQNSGAGGTMGYGEAIQNSGGLITVGSTWHFHCWFRDTSGPCGTGSNLTNLLSVTFQI